MIFVIILFIKKCIVYSVLKYEYDVNVVLYGLEVVEKFNFNVDIVFKILVVSIDNNKFVVVVVFVNIKFSEKKMVKVLGVKKVEMV